MNNWYYNRARALATRDDTPTMTDQSQANDTDINVIVKRYGVHGQVPGTNAQPTYEDLVNFPDNLRDLIDTARGINDHLDKLPPQLKTLSFGELMALTNEQLTHILTPHEQNSQMPNMPTPPQESQSIPATK